MSASCQIHADHPGGNIEVVEQRPGHVLLKQELRDTQGWWFYWNFVVTGAAGQSLVFEFTNGDVFGPRGPAFSSDGGNHWQWLGGIAVMPAEHGTAFRYSFGPEENRVHFAFSIPYVQSDLEAFLRTAPELERSVLCRSREGREVELVSLPHAVATPRFRLLLTARHHACECIANFVIEGIWQEAMAETSTGTWLRRNVAVWSVPFVDKDGVENGDQGKNRQPRDHNRDYDDPAVHPETAAVRRLVSSWKNTQPVITLDVHCPYIRGAQNESIYIVGSADPVNQSRQRCFSRTLESLARGPLPYSDSDFLPFGAAWNTAENYAQGTSCTRWLAAQHQVALALSIEVPYANVGAATVDRQGAREFGRDMARALAAFLAEKEGME